MAVAKAYVVGEATAAELSRVYGISATTIYDWGKLYRARGEAGLAEIRGTSRVPKPDPVREMLAPKILETKKEFSWFGIPRITQWLRRTQLLPVTESQVKKTLKEANLVPKKPKKRRRAEVVRFFERAEPNQLWQTDITMWTIARGQMSMVGHSEPLRGRVIGSHFSPRSSARIRRPTYQRSTATSYVTHRACRGGLPWGERGPEGSARRSETTRTTVAARLLDAGGAQAPGGVDRRLPKPVPADHRCASDGSLMSQPRPGLADYADPWLGSSHR